VLTGRMPEVVLPVAPDRFGHPHQPYVRGLDAAFASEG